jgi:anaerobic selenocysteine-containing dehydrogenase
MDRRKFIKLTAVTGTAATLANCGNPEHDIIRFVPDEDLVPGVATWKPGACPLCRAGCGTIVRVMEGDADVVRNGQAGVVRRSLAKKLEGNPAHPINAGTLCARGQAAIQVPYHPDRITQPLQRTGVRGTGPMQPIAWDVAITALVAKLDALADSAAQASVVYWTRPGASVRRDVIDMFLERFGAAPSASFELFDETVLRRANRLSFGHEQLPTVDLARARYVLSFGADVLGTWNSPVAQSLGYGQMRQGRAGIRGKLVQVEPRMSLTGASADEWVPAHPGTEGVLALGLAHAIMAAKLRTPAAAGQAGALIDGWANGLPDFTPDAVAKQTGISTARIDRLAHELVDQSPAVAVIGGAPLGHTNGLFQALAVNALTSLLSGVGEPGGVSFMPQLPSAAARARPTQTVPATVAALLSAHQPMVQVLIIDEVNPVFALPAVAKTREALLKVPFIVSVGNFVDETSGLADLLLPNHAFLEGWTDSRPESGAAVAVATVAPPAMPALYQTRATADVLLEVSRKLKKPITPPLPGQTYDEVLRASFTAVAGASAAGGDPDDLWSAAQKQGGWWGALKESKEQRAEGRGRAQGNEKVTARKAVDAQFDGDAATYPFYFLPYASQALLDGSLAHLPWLQELPDPLSSAMWSNWVDLNPRTAAKLGIADGDMVEIGSAHGTVRAPAVLSPAVAPDVVAMPVGQGHESFTRYASGLGSNPIAILGTATEPETGALAWAATRVKIARVGGPEGRLVRFASPEEQAERPERGR